MTPKVTVCLPTYNRAGYLTECIESILAQTMTDFEVIISDNCSTDATPDVVRGFRDARLRYVRNESNVGVFRNMNQCLALATGDYVCILHDDDLYAPEFLMEESNLLDCHPSVGFVHCAAYEIDASGNRQRVARAYLADCVRDGKEEFLRYLGGHNVCCSTVMARRTLFREAGGFESCYLCSDFLMWLRLALMADVGYVAKPLAAMRVHGEAMSAGIEPERWCSEYLAILDRGMALAETVCPSMLSSKTEIVQRAIRAQGKRFFIAAAAACARESLHAADGFIKVLRALEVRGLPPLYAHAAGALRKLRIGRLLSVIRNVRRYRAARELGEEAVWCRPRAARCSDTRPA
jgi:hypothetical protein